jgi:4-diphosphocytidyl-2-C-methyl-D-erythritol kinase
VAEAIEWLSQFGAARMTGSGACVFCAFPGESEAAAVRAKVPPQWVAWQARSLARHPLQAVLQDAGEVE